MNTKKENRTAYKNMKFRMGIYRIKNLNNNKILLKPSYDLERAFNSDQFQLRMGVHRNKELQDDWNKLGEIGFEFSIFDEIELKDSVTDIEKRNELAEFLKMHQEEQIKNGVIFY